MFAIRRNVVPVSFRYIKSATAARVLAVRKGKAPGEVATNWELATGTERYEYMARLAGQDPWEDLHPIVQTSMGTKANPVVVKGVDPERYIGCTGESSIV
ncbi:hypothetical protein SmJEL517_g01839 [Synchytrium microbalum]|uniref:Uncharacterized protein n=1 Tax=Synchytrium microbalum TaxID=1806994 RepID=A0A507C9Y2_9FUNG|nr:uncharacterized protein SmJEL517_g01839 [Synchytrium microbalum]TPX35979.1 hypothetical protein SmJEL517_g01839 [Synchytrium microbalum]